MNKEYSKFLSAKLYLIETISGKNLDSESMKKIHEICLASYSDVTNLYADLSWLSKF